MSHYSIRLSIVQLDFNQSFLTNGNEKEKTLYNYFYRIACFYRIPMALGYTELRLGAMISTSLMLRDITHYPLFYINDGAKKNLFYSGFEAW